jgi:ribosomal protein S18 acetylase RimI-like enzyme
MTIQVPRQHAGTRPVHEPQPLQPEDVPRLHLDNHPRLNAVEASTLLRQRPGDSFWIPHTGEFIITSQWRHRQELDTVHTFGAFGHEDALLRAAMARAREQGRAGFVVVDINESRKPSFYIRHGLHRFEEIVTFENRRPTQLATGPIEGGLVFRQVDGTDRGLLESVIALDNATFPWFWWNSSEEFDAYIGYPGVEIWAGIRDHEVVTYAGTTQYRRWSHLDRIATHPDLQGNGLGRAALTHAVRESVRHGARRMALSTQGNNDRSRRLYQRTGFERTPGDDYCIFLASFDDARVHAGMERHRPASGPSGDGN